MEIYKYLISNYSFPNVVNDIYLLAEILDEQDKWRIDALSFNIYRKEIKKIKFLNYAEEQELFVRIQDGDKEAEKKLILANLGFVIHVARKYQNQGLSLNDLISEGYFGLMRAAQTAENRGIRFQSYAYQHIRNSIKQAIIKYGNAICYPDNILAEVNKINKFVSKFHLEYGCLPSLEQISEHIKIPIDKITDILFVIKSGISIERIFEYFEDFDLSETFINLSIEDLPEDYYLYSYLHPVDDELYNESLDIDIEFILNQLTTREKDIIKMYYGIDSKEKDLNEIAIITNLTRERVRQIKEKALRKLRSKAYHSDLLRKYLG